MGAGADASDRFDAEWYRTTHRDVADRGCDPLRHYLDRGWREGRNPNPFYSTRRYLADHPELVGRGINPFIHYVLTRRG